MSYKSIAICILFSSVLFAQEYGTGALLNESKFILSPKSPPITRGDLKKLPIKFSLKHYTPTPKNQGNYSTCTGWATSYAARTILEAIKNDWRGSEVNKNAFSPSYVYNQIRPTDGCNGGASLIDGLELITKQGVLPFKEFGYDCERKVNDDDKKRANKFKVKEYREIISRTSKNKTLNIKKSLTQLKPIVAGIHCPKSLFRAKGVWHPNKKDYEKITSGHALTVIGYDDNIEGGAFEIMNSWGVDWGNGGYLWIRYEDFEHFCVWAGELIDEQNNKGYNQISSEIFIRKLNNKIFQLRKNENSYSLSEKLKVGDKFQLYLKNRIPSHLNIFSYDSTSGLKHIFPFDERTSEFIAYKNQTVIIPGEDYTFELDDNFGLSEFIIIVSTSELKEYISNFLSDSTKIKKDFHGLLSFLSSKIKVYLGSNLKDTKIILEDISKNNFASVVKIDINYTAREEK